MKSIFQTSLVVMLCLVCISVVLRLFSFFPWVIDHDESTYLVIGHALNQGMVYLRDVIDTKPIGIFWIYSFLLKIGCDSIFWTRALAAMVVGITAYGLYLLQKHWTNHHVAAASTALIYITFVSLYKRWGLGPNTEIYFNALIVFALVLLFIEVLWWKDFIAACLLAFAFHVKYVAAADILAIGLFLMHQAYRDQAFKKFMIKRLSLLIFGGMLVSFLVFSYFIHHDLWNVYVDTNLRIGQHYASPIPVFDRVLFLLDFALRFLPFTALAFWGFFQKESKHHAIKHLLWLWLLLDLIMVLYPGKRFEHYFIQCMPVVSLLSGFALSTQSGEHLFAFFKTRRWMQGLIGILIGLLFYSHWRSFVHKADPAKEAYDQLHRIIRPGEGFYTGNTYHLLYFKFNQKSPTPYIHSSLLWNKDHRRALNLNEEVEIDRIRNQSPTYVLWDPRSDEKELRDRLLKGYTLLDTTNKRMFVYRKDP